jgi:CheY-like chemotaxis protein
MRILYADDDRDDCQLLFEALHEIDPSIICMMANDGKEALTVLAQSKELPDFIFLDVNMPVMDGRSCLMELKKDNRFKNIPVIIYSTTTNKSEIYKLFQLGAADYIRKPNTFDELCRTLQLKVMKMQSPHPTDFV